MTKTQSPAASKAEYKRMMQKPIPGLLLSLALPTMGSMLITSIYNLADTFFVARLGVEASGAVGITFSLMALIQAAGFTLGMGGGSLISLRLGKRQVHEAGQIAGASFYLSLLCGLLIASIAFWREPFLRLLGASETILPHAVSYSLYIFIAAPFLTGSLCLSHLLRAEGKTARALLGIAVGGFLNILLDPLLLQPLGIQGIALATLLSQAACFAVLLSAFLTGKSSLSLRFSGFRFSGRIFLTGFPSLLRQGLAAASAILLNRCASLYGDAVVTAMSIAGKIFMIVFTLMLGYGQGLQPLIGFNYAQHNTQRIRRAFHFCLWTGTAALTLLGALIFWQAPALIRLFMDEAEVVRIASLSLRAGALTMPLLPACTIANLSFQSVNRPVISSFLAGARQGLFFLPLILLLPGLWGVQLAQAFADAATFLLSVPFLIYFLRKAVDKKPSKV